MKRTSIHAAGVLLALGLLLGCGGMDSPELELEAGEGKAERRALRAMETKHLSLSSDKNFWGAFFEMCPQKACPMFLVLQVAPKDDEVQPAEGLLLSIFARAGEDLLNQAVSADGEGITANSELMWSADSEANQAKRTFFLVNGTGEDWFPEADVALELRLEQDVPVEVTVDVFLLSKKCKRWDYSGLVGICLDDNTTVHFDE